MGWCLLSSIYAPHERPSEDLTARARIRDAAMVQFAERGFKEATLRSIAEAAGVSVGLVQHHFGSKETLRRCCDEAVLEVIRRQLGLVGTLQKEAANPGFAAALYDQSPVLVRYMIRLLLEGTPQAQNLFDELAKGTEVFLSHSAPDLFPPGSDEAREAGAVMVAMHLGTAVLHEHLSRHMGIDITDRASAPRIGLVMLDIYATMGQWVASETGREAREAVARYLADLSPSTEQADKEQGDD